MTLTEEFITYSVDDLASPDFRTRLSKELERSSFVLMVEAVGGIVSFALAAIGLLVLFGYLKGNPNSEPLSVAIAGMVGIAGAFLMLHLFQGRRTRRAYRSILTDPTNWSLENAEINRVSQFAFPTTGSDNNAVRVFWVGTNSGVASIETNRHLTKGRRITIATSQKSAPLIVSLNIKKLSRY
ncbi:hypothetical protein N9L47_01635 [Rhodobacteraceae bacterium]|nr:hypothetical protein [Paracoccaceae bacterium]